MAVSKLNPSSAANDFNIQLTGSYVKVDLSKEYAAGAYSFISGNNDTSLDVYAFNADGSLAGSTSTKSLVTTKGFSKVVVVGGANGDILSFSYKQTFTTTTASAENGVPPIAVSVSPSALPNVNDSTTVSGYNFGAGMTASFIGTDNVTRNAKSVVVGSSTSAIITRPDVFPVSASPYDLSLSLAGVNPPVGSTVSGLENAITAGSGPSWVTTTPLATFTVNSAYSATLQATDPDPAGSISSYTIISGSLPTGLTLASTSGVISGTPTSSTVATFTVRATNQDGDYSDRAFTMPNAGPTWTTAAGNITSGIQGSSYTFTLVATDDSGVSPTYTITSGSLPTGLTLTSTSGVISGTVGGSASTSSFTVTATDVNGSSAARSFTIPVVAIGVWTTISTSITNVTSASDVYGGYYNGFIYQGGGQYNASPTVYPTQWYKVDVSTGVATILASAPEPRDEMGSIWVGNKHYVVVGYNQNGNSGTYSTVMIYNDATNSWSIGAAHPGGNGGLSHCGTDGTNLYAVASGGGMGNTMTRYNISSNTWTTLASVAGMSTSQGYRMPYSASRGKFYNLGYNSNSPAGYNLHIYDVASNSWSRNSSTIPKTYDSPFQGGDNYAWGFDINPSQTYLYIYGYDALLSKTSPSRAMGAGPADKILRYDIVADSWSQTSYTDVGYCGGASGTDGAGAYYKMSGYVYDGGGNQQYPRKFSVIYLP